MPRCYWTISSNPNSHKCFYSVYDVCILNAQFVCTNGFYSVYRRLCFHEWHIVPQLCVQIKQSRTRSRKALAECKASRRLGKQIRGLYMFLLKPTLQQSLPLKLILCHKTEKGGCPRLSILHIRLCLYSFYEATSSLRISHNPSFVILLSEDSSRRSTYHTMLMILLASYYHSAQNVCRPMTVAVCNNGVVYMPS